MVLHPVRQESGGGQFTWNQGASGGSMIALARKDKGPRQLGPLFMS
jgi:hypothetical protein